MNISSPFSLIYSSTFAQSLNLLLNFDFANLSKENGIFKGELFDKYDFQWLNKEKLPNSETRKINNIAYFFQTIRKIKNYYVIIPVRFRIGN